MREHYGDKWADILRYYLDNFEDSLTGVVPGARVLVNDLKAAGIGVWGLSNWEKELFPIALKHCEILQRLDGRLVSGYVHMRKPHKDIYEKALEEFGISAESSVFIDDKAMNIAGANEAGDPRHSLLGRPQAARAADRAGHRYPGGSVTSARRPAFDDDDRADGLKSQYRGRKRNTC